MGISEKIGWQERRKEKKKRFCIQALQADEHVKSSIREPTCFNQRNRASLGRYRTHIAEGMNVKLIRFLRSMIGFSIAVVQMLIDPS